MVFEIKCPTVDPYYQEVSADWEWICSALDFSPTQAVLQRQSKNVFNIQILL